MTTDDPLLDSVRRLVERIAGPTRVPLHSGPDTRLGEEYWLDSVELLEVLIACEHEFNIAFDGPRDLEAGSFDTLGTLARLVRSKQSARR
jgi:acyl carrier protein